MAKFTLGPQTFSSKEAAKKEVARIQHCSVGAMLTEQQTAIVRAVFDMHPYAAEKGAKGISYFVVRQHNNYIKGKWEDCFFVVHPDGSSTPFSFHTAFGRRKNAIDAARVLIAEEQLAAKYAYFAGKQTARCQISGVPINFNTSDVHHAPPWTFARIWQEFVAGWGEPKLMWPSPNEIAPPRFADPAMAENFLVFHEVRANLQVVHREVHQHAI